MSSNNNGILVEWFAVVDGVFVVDCVFVVDGVFVDTEGSDDNIVSIGLLLQLKDKMSTLDVPLAAWRHLLNQVCFPHQ